MSNRSDHGPRYTSDRDVLAAYADGERMFAEAQLDGANFRGANLEGARFFGASLRGADFSHANLTHTQLKAADLTDATLIDTSINATDLIGANFSNACFIEADLTGASLQNGTCTGADFHSANLGNARLGRSDFSGARLDNIYLRTTDFSDLNFGPFCDASEVSHGGPSTIDARGIIKSYRHPRVKAFMIECGVPPLFAEYLIDCAVATSEPLLRTLMQTTFISYGGPDEAFASKLYFALRAHDAIVFFFPETAQMGERIDREVYRQLQDYDRVVLVCSEDSLNRPGVLHEINETLDREARDGGATYLLPVTLDDYVFTGWREQHPELAERVARRVVGDFRGTVDDDEAFDRALGRLLSALKSRRPGQRQ